MGFSSTSTASVLGKKLEYLFGKNLSFYGKIYPTSDLVKRPQAARGRSPERSDVATYCHGLKHVLLGLFL